ncbi:MAG: L,D-transpeptidase family protein, partial [Gaiella sp.]
RSSIPGRATLRSVTVRQQVATIDLSAAFALGLGRVSLRERIDQLVRTALSAPGVKGVRVRIEGGVPIGMFPGYDLRRVVTAPNERATERPGTRDLQQALVDLGFMDVAGVTGEIDTRTTTAVLAFQKWAGLPRTGVVDAATTARVLESTRPRPALRAPGRRIEVQLGRQLALLIRNGRVVRTVHVSSGAGGATPLGTFHVYRKERFSWSVPFSVWLPWASYFVGGVAFHEFGSVPTYAASHGCIRVSHYDAEMLYGFADFGTQVDVFHETEVRA